MSQPPSLGPYNCQLPSKSSSVYPTLIKASLGASMATLQWLHKRLASRCAVISDTADAILNGATPMFIKRVRVDGASLVCNVDNTMWPVDAALMAISAV